MNLSPSSSSIRRSFSLLCLSSYFSRSFVSQGFFSRRTSNSKIIISSEFCQNFKPSKYLTMSSRRSSRSRQSSSRNNNSISDDQITDLVSKLQQLLPEIRPRRSNKASASKVLQETCNYIRNLHREVDDLSERLSELLATTDMDNDQAAIIRSLLM